MIPVKDQYIKLFLRNGTHVEGYVEQWSDRQAILRSDDGLSYLVVQNVTEDVMLIKIFNEPESVIDPEYKAPKEPPFYPRRDMTEEFERVRREPAIDEHLKAKTLLELRKLQIEQDRKIISERLKDHTPTQIKVTNYELPRFFKKQSAK